MNKGGVFGQMRPKERKMQKWDYNFYVTSIQQEERVSFNSTASMVWTKRKNETVTAMDEIRKMGIEGWELVSVTPVSTSTGSDFAGVTREILFTFKRPVD